MDFGYHRANRIIVHGRSIAEDVHEGLAIPMENIDVVPHVAIGNGGGPPTVDENERSVLFFGRIWPYKGLEYLVKAEPLISETVENVEITIAGKGEDLERYRRLMRDPERFSVINSRVSDEERASLFQRSAVVVVPYVSATQSGVVQVAHSYGKPVVATSVGALPEYVDHGRTGLLVPPRDERALADAVVRLLQDSQLRHTMGENGKRQLKKSCAPDVVARKTAEVYERTIRERRPGRGSEVDEQRTGSKRVTKGGRG
jgi:glycosyltransferase involved in cell wall biosynthesis